MNSLNKELRHLLTFYGVKKDQLEQAIQDIEGKFKDDGWLHEIDVSLPAVTPYASELSMTGSEWLARFEKELRKLDIGYEPDDHMDDFHFREVLDAARRASGVK